MSQAPAYSVRLEHLAARLSPRGAASLAPNPVWLREMWQATRMRRTPVLLTVATITIALLACSVAAVASFKLEPAHTGSVLFHTIFSCAYFVVTWLTPAFAAYTIANERSEQTLEPLLLTRMGIRSITHGKFLAAFTHSAMYLVMLAPVAALIFLFGGVTAPEVAMGFVWLLVFAMLSTGFGLSISASVSTPSAALMLWFPLGGVASVAGYLLGGVGLSFLAHELWPFLIKGAPVWLPSVYVRGVFDWDYALLLLIGPSLLITMVAWFFYELTLAGLSQQSDDHSSGLRRWFVTAACLLFVLAPWPAWSMPRDRWLGSIAAIGLADLTCVFGLFLFAGEPLEPSRRTRAVWEQQRASGLRRFLGPGIIPAVVLVVIAGLLMILASTLGGFLGQLGDERLAEAPINNSILIVSGLYSASFLILLAGLTVFFRSRSDGGSAPRLLLSVCAFVVSVGPWIFAGLLAATGLLGSADNALMLAAPSPAFLFVLIDSVQNGDPLTGDYLVAGAAACTIWVSLGLFLFVSGTRRVRHVLRERHFLERKATLTSLRPSPPDAPVAADSEQQTGANEPGAPPRETTTVDDSSGGDS